MINNRAPAVKIFQDVRKYVTFINSFNQRKYFPFFFFQELFLTTHNPSSLLSIYFMDHGDVEIAIYCKLLTKQFPF